jgi:hypothetical protein
MHLNFIYFYFSFTYSSYYSYVLTRESVSVCVGPFVFTSDTKERKREAGPLVNRHCQCVQQ